MGKSPRKVESGREHRHIRPDVVDDENLFGGG
jgi:hypothetical protein